MGEPIDKKLPDKEPPEIRSDSFKLDFGKNAFHIDTKRGAKPFEKKLPPEPGRVPPAKSVPLAEVLNRPSKADRGEEE